MSELFDKASEFALEPDMFMGGRMPRIYADEGQHRLLSQAFLALSQIRLMARKQGFNEEYHGFQGKAIANLNRLKANIDNWDQQPDGTYSKTFSTPEALAEALNFMTEVMRAEDDYRGPLKKGLTLSMPALDYDMVFNPTRYAKDPSRPVMQLPESIRKRLTNNINGRVELVHLDIGNTTTSAFALAHELAERMYAPSVSPQRCDQITDEVVNVIRKAAQASKKLHDEASPVKGDEQSDLMDADRDGKLYGSAHGLLMEAKDRVEKKSNRNASVDAEADMDMARLMKMELEQLHREILGGWKPYKDGCVSKVFKGHDKGPETLSFLMQMYAVASYGKPPVLEPEQLARDADVIKVKSTTGGVGMRVVVPAALLKMAQENEQQLGI